MGSGRREARRVGAGRGAKGEGVEMISVFIGV